MSSTWSRTSRTSSTSDRPGILAQATGHAAGVIRLVHPFPSLLDAVLTTGLARLAGAGLDRAALLGMAMLGLQVSIGSLNDLVDMERDRGLKPGKPLPRGLVSVRVARAVVAAGVTIGLLLSLAAGPLVLAVGLVGVTIGYAYDLRLKASAWSWLPFAVGLPLLPVYAWLGATGSIPGAFLLLVPLAVLGGAAAALANELADEERDREAGVWTAVRALGRQRAWRLDAGLQAIVAVAGVASLVVNGAPIIALGAADGSAALVMVGVGLSRSRRPGTRERGWEIQVVGLGCLALAWVGGLVSLGRL